jgi:cytidine deaminase
LIEENLDTLIAAAKTAREKSVAPFSKFMVGAAIETEDGKVYTGCNIESASFGLTVCAERVAIWKALSEGERKFKTLVISADTETLTPPCGTCRQIIWEFCKHAKIVLTNLHGQQEVLEVTDLLPRAFDARFLKEAQSK